MKGGIQNLMLGILIKSGYINYCELKLKHTHIRGVTVCVYFSFLLPGWTFCDLVI